MDNNWVFYSKLFKHVIEKYYNPKITYHYSYIVYHINTDHWTSYYRYYFTTNDWCNHWSTWRWGFMNLKNECSCIVKLIGYERL
jgi:hypothetical protein